MIGYALVNEKNQYYHPTHGWLSIDGPDLRLMDLSQAIKFQAEMDLEDETEIYRVTVTYEKEEKATVDAEVLGLIYEALDDLPSYARDLVNRLIADACEATDKREPIVVNEWAVESSSNPNTEYRVTCDSEYGWRCTCPDFTFRRQKRGGNCKHIYAVHNRNSAFPLSNRVRLIK